MNALAAAGIGAVSLDIVFKIEQQGLGAVWVAVSASAWAFPSLFFGERLSYLARAYNDAKVTSVCMFIACLSAIAYTWTDQALVWIVLQVLSGATFSIFWITCEKYLSFLSTKRSSGLTFTIYAAMPVFGYTAGILVQQSSIDSHPTLIYFLAAAARIATAVLFLFLIPASKQLQTNSHSDRKNSASNGTADKSDTLLLIQLAVIAGFFEAVPWGLAQTFFLDAGWQIRQSSSIVYSFFWGQFLLSVVLGKVIDQVQPRTFLVMLGVFALAIAAGTWFYKEHVLFQLFIYFGFGGISGAVYGFGLATISRTFSIENREIHYARFLRYFCGGTLFLPSLVAYQIDTFGPVFYPICIGLAGIWLLGLQKARFRLH